MKLGIFSFVAALLLAFPAMAGTDPCAADPGDDDSDGVCNAIDNCSEVVNPTQCDTDSDGHGNHCDCDFDQTNTCAGADFTIFGGSFGQTVPPGNPDTDMDCSGTVAGGDFTLFGAGFGSAPGPSCGNPVGVPCP